MGLLSAPCPLLAAAVLLLVPALPHATADVRIVSKWLKHNKDRTVKVEVSLTTNCDLSGWAVDLRFGRKVIDFEAWNIHYSCINKQACRVTNVDWNSGIKAGKTYHFEFIATFRNKGMPRVAAAWVPGLCSDSPTHSHTHSHTPSPTASPTASPTPSPPPQPESPVPGTAENTGAGVVETSNWMEGSDRMLEAEVVLQAPCALTAWSVILSFSEIPKSFQTWNANHGVTCIGVYDCLLTNKYQAHLQTGETLKFKFHVSFGVSFVPQVSAQWEQYVCDGQATPAPATSAPATSAPATPAPATPAPATPTPAPPAPATPAPATPAPATPAPATSAPATPAAATPTPTTGDFKYNYPEVLAKSILFYEAQRSGKLPANNRIPWRKDSALQDGDDVRHDLTGGWYDAGDYVKFNFPMASSVTLLAWGMIRHKQAYVYAGEWERALDSIKWPLEYLIKCHTAPNELYGQVGNGVLDHAWWGRPEDMTMARPAYKVSASKPGSDLAAETAAAMAAGSIVFKEINATFAATLLSHARSLYTFADTYRGKYSDSIADAAIFYRSYNGYVDELAWAAAWLHKATREAGYLQQAKAQLNQLSDPHELSWDDKGIGASLLIYEASPDDVARAKITSFIHFWLHEVHRTPQGLAWVMQWGPNRYAANAAFALQVAADLGFAPQTCRDFAETQINYMLGDAGRSYVVGFGHNPPQRPHHSSSSCPSAPAACNWSTYNSPDPNPHVLYGALVGGPSQDGSYQDKRSDYIKNEVTTDYNAGFQSAVAGLLQIKMPVM